MNSRDYWAKREEEALKIRIKDEKEYSKEIHQIYDNMLNSIQDQIDAFYERYATAEGISLAEAKKRVSQADIKAYERKAKQYVKNKDFSDKANREMRLYNATMKINRLELLKANIGLEMVKGHEDMDNFMREILEDRTIDELRRQAGILGDTVHDNAKRVDAIVNGSFKVDKVGSKTTFSDRIWQYQDVMKQDLSKLLQTGLIQGKNSRALAGDLRKYWYGKDPKTGGGAVFCMERLMRTELARVQTEAQKQSYADNDIEEYEYIANSRCCDACQALDGKIFKVKDMMPGENAAPLHPNCRCSCGAYEDEEEYEAWLSFIENGGTTKEWNRLKKGLDNDGKNGIIRAGAIHGAYTNKNDPKGKKREASAVNYYEEIRNRDRKTEISVVAKNTGFSENEIDMVFAHIFELDHLFDDGTIHRFDPDYYMQNSWMRLREGKNIQNHDITLIRHELEEAKIMGDSTEIVYNVVHAEVEKKYNYKKDLLEYLKNHDA